jgi:DNA-binding PadR family transcriptional regulator
LFAGGGFGGEEWFAPARGQAGRRRGRMFGPGELRLLLLTLLADAPRHGYELIKAVEELTGGAYAPSPGTVYPTLQLLADEGAIAERQDADSSRKAYAATAQGRTELDARAAEVRALMERLAGIAEERRAAPHLQVNRAMENLRNALRMQRHRDALRGETLDAIVNLIDETARRIERM